MICLRAPLTGKVAIVTGAVPGALTGRGRSARGPSFPGGAACTSARAGVLGCGRPLARGVARHGVNVNAILPGATHTALTREGVRGATHVNGIGQVAPLGRWRLPQEQANALLFLVSDAVSFITEATPDVNGERTMI